MPTQAWSAAPFPLDERRWPIRCSTVRVLENEHLGLHHDRLGFLI
jgi:hypothetical protein